MRENSVKIFFFLAFFVYFRFCSLALDVQVLKNLTNRFFQKNFYFFFSTVPKREIFFFKKHFIFYFLFLLFKNLFFFKKKGKQTHCSKAVKGQKQRVLSSTLQLHLECKLMPKRHQLSPFLC